jgi:nitrous oxide reductase
VQGLEMDDKSEKVTDKQVYLNRRLFMKAAALAGTATASTLLYRRVYTTPAAHVEGD